MTRRRAALANLQAAPAGPIPAFDPADYLHAPREGFDEWSVTAAAVLYLRRHRIADGSPYAAAERLAAVWLADRATS